MKDEDSVLAKNFHVAPTVSNEGLRCQIYHETSSWSFMKAPEKVSMKLPEKASLKISLPYHQPPITRSMDKTTIQILLLVTTSLEWVLNICLNLDAFPKNETILNTHWNFDLHPNQYHEFYILIFGFKSFNSLLPKSFGLKMSHLTNRRLLVLIADETSCPVTNLFHPGIWMVRFTYFAVY